jgi:hypothetical protein
VACQGLDSKKFVNSNGFHKFFAVVAEDGVGGSGDFAAVVYKRSTAMRVSSSYNALKAYVINTKTHNFKSEGFTHTM